MDTSQARVAKWNDLPVDRPMPLIERRRVIGEKMMLSEVRLTRGFTLATHQHENEQLVCLIKGKMRFVIAEGSAAERAVILSAGEVLVIPGHVPHSAEALEDCVAWDLFSPISEKTGVDRA